MNTPLESLQVPEPINYSGILCLILESSICSSLFLNFRWNSLVWHVANIIVHLLIQAYFLCIFFIILINWYLPVELSSQQWTSSSFTVCKMKDCWCSWKAGNVNQPKEHLQWCPSVKMTGIQQFQLSFIVQHLTSDIEDISRFLFTPVLVEILNAILSQRLFQRQGHTLTWPLKLSTHLCLDQSYIQVWGGINVTESKTSIHEWITGTGGWSYCQWTLNHFTDYCE